MDENNKNGEFKVEVDKEELKNQTKETMNQAKETIKNMDFKKDATATKGFVLEMISKPLSAIEDVVTEKENRFSTAIILIILWAVLEIVSKITGGYFKIGNALFSVLTPIIFIVSFTIATVLFGGKEKKSISTIISAITISKVPTIIAMAIDIVCDLIQKLKYTTLVFRFNSICSSALNFISIALLFVSIKGLITKDDEDIMFRKIAVISFVGYAIINVVKMLGF